METKHYIYLGVTIGSALGSWIGSMLDHSYFGVWGIILGAIGGLAGLWAGYKLGTEY